MHPQLWIHYLLWLKARSKGQKKCNRWTSFYEVKLFQTIYKNFPQKKSSDTKIDKVRFSFLDWNILRVCETCDIMRRNERRKIPKYFFFVHYRSIPISVVESIGKYDYDQFCMLRTFIKVGICYYHGSTKIPKVLHTYAHLTTFTPLEVFWPNYS